MPYIVNSVNVVSRKKLIAFWQKHPESLEVLAIWYRSLRKSNPQNFAQLKDLFNAIDLAFGFTIFDVGGNKFRVVVVVDYQYVFAKIRHVFTHEEYNQWNAKSEAHKQHKKGKRNDN